MNRNITLFIIFLSISVLGQTQKSFEQPDRVFIQSSGSSPQLVQSTKEVVLIYLEDAMGDSEGELLLQVEYKNNLAELLGKIYHPPTNKNWYFYAEWNMTTKGGGFLIYKIDYSKYKKLSSSFYNDLN